MDLAARKAVRELGCQEGPCLMDFACECREKYDAMIERIRQQLGLTTLKYQKLEDLVQAIGLPKEKLCTYCWDGADLK